MVNTDNKQEFQDQVLRNRIKITETQKKLVEDKLVNTTTKLLLVSCVLVGSIIINIVALVVIYIK